MAISDYLMSRLAAAGNARQLALQLEQAKAARDAAAQRATTGYIQQLLQAGGSLATQVPQQMAADAAIAAKKLDEEIALRARAGEIDVEEPITGIQPVLPMPEGSFKGPKLAFDYSEPAAPAVVPETPAAKQPTLSPEDVAKIRSTGVAGADLSKLGLADKKLSPEDVAKIRSTGVAGADIDKLLPTAPVIKKEKVEVPAMGPAAQKVFSGGPVPAVSEEEMKGAFTQPPSMPIPGVKGITVQDVTGLIVQQTPAEPEAKKEYINTVLPDIPEFKLQTGLDLNKPAVATAVESAKTGYVPLRFKNTVDEAAEIVAKQVEERLPRDNPLTKFFMFGKSSGNYEHARDMAKLKAKVLIQEERKAASAEHMKSYLNSLDVEEREAKIGLIRAQTVLNESKSENVVKFKTDLPSTERGKLQGFDLAQKSLGNLMDTTRDALKEGKGLPIGTDRLMAQAYVKANAAKQGSDAASISAGTGVLGGANLSISQAKSGKPLDETLLMDAFESVDRSGWTPKQKLMHMEKFKTIQNLGKALEGGKLTDADYKKYVEILINSDDPQTYLMSINRLMKDNYENYSNYKTNLGGTYEERVLVGFDPKDPTSMYFNEDEISSAFAAPIGAAAQSLAQQGATYRGPGTAVTPLVGGAATQIQELAKKAAALAAAGDVAGAAAVRAEIDKIKAGNKPAPAPAAKKSGSVFK